MKYENVIPAEFVRRDNRFIATVKTELGIEKVHVKNTGRCRELLLEGARVYLAVSDNKERRTRADIIAVEKNTDRGTILINMDAQAPNKMAAEWLAGGLFSNDAQIRAEVAYGKSRFDFYVEDAGRRAFVEVKGVTLENDRIASFPDAPTERGRKHLSELIMAKKEGYDAYVLFVVQLSDVNVFCPNFRTDPKFSKMLIDCKENGVNILAYKSAVFPDEIYITDPVRILLNDNVN